MFSARRNFRLPCPPSHTLSIVHPEVQGCWNPGTSLEDVERWQTEVIVPLAQAIAEGSAHLSFSTAKLNHKRGCGFAALASGPSHGGGGMVGFLSFLLHLGSYFSCFCRSIQAIEFFHRKNAVSWTIYFHMLLCDEFLGL